MGCCASAEQVQTLTKEQQNNNRRESNEQQPGDNQHQHQQHQPADTTTKAHSTSATPSRRTPKSSLKRASSGVSEKNKARLLKRIDSTRQASPGADDTQQQQQQSHTTPTQHHKTVATPSSPPKAQRSNKSPPTAHRQQSSPQAATTTTATEGEHQTHSRPTTADRQGSVAKRTFIATVVGTQVPRPTGGHESKRNSISARERAALAADRGAHDAAQIEAELNAAQAQNELTNQQQRQSPKSNASHRSAASNEALPTAAEQQQQQQQSTNHNQHLRVDSHSAHQATRTIVGSGGILTAGPSVSPLDSGRRLLHASSTNENDNPTTHHLTNTTNSSRASTRRPSILTSALGGVQNIQQHKNSRRASLASVAAGNKYLVQQHQLHDHGPPTATTPHITGGEDGSVTSPHSRHTSDALLLQQQQQQQQQHSPLLQHPGRRRSSEITRQTLHKENLLLLPSESPNDPQHQAQHQHRKHKSVDSQGRVIHRRRSEMMPSTQQQNGQLQRTTSNDQQKPRLKYRKKRRTSHNGLMNVLALQFPVIKKSFAFVHSLFEKNMNAAVPASPRSGTQRQGPPVSPIVHGSSAIEKSVVRRSSVQLLGSITVDKLQSILNSLARADARSGARKSKWFNDPETIKLFKLDQIENSHAGDVHAVRKDVITFKEFLIAMAMNYYLSTELDVTPSDAAAAKGSGASSAQPLSPNAGATAGLVSDFAQVQRGFSLIQQAFMAMDEDGSGAISPEELKHSLFSLSGGAAPSGAAGSSDPTAPPAEQLEQNKLLERRLKELDLQTTGEIAFPEFLYACISWIGLMDED